jgi:hypothetical protein
MMNGSGFPQRAGDEFHHCITTGLSQHNEVWATNPDFVPYRESHPET